jgi:hypothetical protein
LLNSDAVMSDHEGQFSRRGRTHQSEVKVRRLREYLLYKWVSAISCFIRFGPELN